MHGKSLLQQPERKFLTSTAHWSTVVKGWSLVVTACHHSTMFALRAVTHTW